MKTFITDTTGKKKEVKNLGWLIRHAAQVTHITLSDRTDGARCGCAFVADLAGGTTYTTAFNSTNVARAWVTRRCLRHVVITDHATIL